MRGDARPASLAFLVVALQRITARSGSNDSMGPNRRAMATTAAPKNRAAYAILSFNGPLVLAFANCSSRDHGS
jgi:hypothetical protein